MKAPLLLAVHLLTSFAFMLGAEHLVLIATAKQASVAIGCFALLQFGTAVTIILSARPPKRVVVTLGGCAAVLWALFCSFLATMAVTGNWL